MRGASEVQPWLPTDLVQKFAERLMLTPNELRIFEQIILATAKPIPRRRDIMVEGRPNPAIYFVFDGLLMRYRILREGQRQVVNVIVPGDAAGAPSCFFTARFIRSGP